MSFDTPRSGTARIHVAGDEFLVSLVLEEKLGAKGYAVHAALLKEIGRLLQK